MSSRFARLRTLLLVALLLAAPAGTSWAAITTTGDVTPDPSTTSSDDYLYIGDTADGSMLVDDGSDVASYRGYLGYDDGATGSATVDGTGSTWTSSDRMYVGMNGTGILSVTGGAAVSSASGRIGANPGATGVVTVDGAGSTWTNSTLHIGSGYFSGNDGLTEAGAGTLNISNGGLVEVSGQTFVGASGEQGTIHFDGGTLNTDVLQAAPYQLTGTGTVNTHGLVADVDLLFDSSHGLQQQLTWQSQPGQDITVNLDVTDSFILGAGHEGEGSLTISDGVAVSTWMGQLGYQVGSSGTVSVEGPGATWNLTYTITVGECGEGTLSITNGGTVNSSSAMIGYRIGSSGTVIVEGSGSSWTTNAAYIGRYGDGALVVRDGATVDSGYRADLGYGDDAAGTAIITGAGSTWTTNNLSVGNSERKSTLTIADGGQVIGGSGGVNTLSEATVEGPGSAWNVTGQMFVSGALSVSSGAQLESGEARLLDGPDSPGGCTVDGPNTTWTNAGDLYVTPYYASSVLNITNGGQLSSGAGMLGDGEPDSGYDVYNPDSGATARVNVDGAGSAWTNGGDLIVGGDASAVLMITDGGQVTSNETWIGYSSNKYFSTSGNVTVSGFGSTWTNSGRLSVGYRNDGSLNISDGGEVTCSNARIGYASNGTGTVTIDGDGSVWTVDGELVVGSYGVGTLEILDGTVDIAGRLRLASDDDAIGTVNLAGGLLRMHGDMLMFGQGASAAFSFTGGRLEGAGTIQLGVPFAPLVQQGGTLAPGNSAGVTTINGGYTLDAGALEIEINGLGTGGTDWDLVNVVDPVDLVGGNGLLDGLLSVILGFAPSAGDEFLVLENDEDDPIIGMFATGTTARAAYDGDLYQFTIDYAAGDGNDIALVTQGVIGVLGDYDADGTVDAADYTVWCDALGSVVAPYFGADGNGNGVVDEADYGVWKSHYGATASGGSLANNAVPEPAGALLLCLGVVVVWLGVARSADHSVARSADHFVVPGRG